MSGRINQTDPATGLAFVNVQLWVFFSFFWSHPGKPPQTGTGTILLYLSDINDHMPSLVAPALDVCHRKEGTPLVIEAKSALARSHSGPFTFELPEDSEDVKHNWTLGRNFGELFFLCSSWVYCQLWALWLFHYLLPLWFVTQEEPSKYEVVVICEKWHCSSSLQKCAQTAERGIRQLRNHFFTWLNT